MRILLQFGAICLLALLTTVETASASCSHQKPTYCGFESLVTCRGVSNVSCDYAIPLTEYGLDQEMTELYAECAEHCTGGMPYLDLISGPDYDPAENGCYFNTQNGLWRHFRRWRYKCTNFPSS